jgi:hypothetical protein
VREIEYIVRNGLTIVKAASLDRLVEKLMDPYLTFLNKYGSIEGKMTGEYAKNSLIMLIYYRDPEFSDIMFLCYNYFMQASTLLDSLIQ